MNRLHKNQQIILTSKIFLTGLVFRFKYFQDKKIVEIKNEETCELGIYNDNPVFRNFETERPISDFQLKKANINNMCS